MASKQANRHIAPGLAKLAVDVSTLEPDPDNARRHDERNVAAIAESLARFGQQLPIIVDGERRVIAGNGMLEAARRLGWRRLAAITTDQVGTSARALALALNRTAELATWDQAVLAAQIDEILKSDVFAGSPIGWNEDEITGLLAGMGDILEAEGGGIEPFRPERPVEMAWILIGVPLALWPDAMGPVAKLREIAGVNVETTR